MVTWCNVITKFMWTSSMKLQIPRFNADLIHPLCWVIKLWFWVFAKELCIVVYTVSSYLSLHKLSTRLHPLCAGNWSETAQSEIVRISSAIITTYTQNSKSPMNVQTKPFLNTNSRNVVILGLFCNSGRIWVRTSVQRFFFLTETTVSICYGVCFAEYGAYVPWLCSECFLISNFSWPGTRSCRSTRSCNNETASPSRDGGLMVLRVIYYSQNSGKTVWAHLMSLSRQAMQCLAHGKQCSV